jgi:hypothetical protein
VGERSPQSEGGRVAGGLGSCGGDSGRHLHVRRQLVRALRRRRAAAAGLGGRDAPEGGGVRGAGRHHLRRRSTAAARG